MKGLEPSTFCMASRRSSQLSYIRERGPIIAAALRVEDLADAPAPCRTHYDELARVGEALQPT